MLDALPRHLALRAALDLRAPPPATASALASAGAIPWRETTGHERFVARYDGPQHGDPARTARYLTALAAVRALADARAPLAWPALADVQARVLGGPAPFRGTDAYARGGQHCYAYTDDLPARFAAAIRDWQDDAHPPIVRAVLAYLDVIFVHPFADGNARAARLWYEYTLRAHRLPTPALHDVVRLPKTPGDAASFWRFVHVTAASIVATTRPSCHNAP